MNLTLNGESVATQKVQVVKSNEQVNHYLLDDGTTLSIRTVITGVYRFEGKQDEHGNPIYHVNWHVIPTTEPGERL